MPFITLFSAPKSFADPHIATIQRNAIKSWTMLPDVEVLLLGEEPGLAETAAELHVQHIETVARNAGGTPLISSMFDLARESSHSDFLCIINSDMILMSDFVEAARLVGKRKDKFVMLSQRWDLDVTGAIEFAQGWQDRLSSIVHGQGSLHRPAGSDFFLFPRSCYLSIPDFAIGRAGWDNWMIYKARHERWPVVDGTPSVMIVHQNHDYSHLPGGETHHTSPETDENIRLAGGEAAVRYTIVDATHRLAGGTLARPAMSYLRFMRGLELLLRRIFYFLPEDMIEEVARPKRWKKRLQKLFRIR
ncbi:MAG TPA: hypothetical protein VGJ22_09520 [Anaerolineales bacterium]